jgi:hypothetical protein
MLKYLARETCLWKQLTKRTNLLTKVNSSIQTSTFRWTHDLKLEFDSGTIELNYKNLARLADSSATGRLNETSILVTVVNKRKSQPASFLPLTVILIL